MGPTLVRLAWHSSGTYWPNGKFPQGGNGGSNGCRIRFNPEKSWGANAGLHLAMDFLEPIKTNEITYADLYTLAGAVAIEHMGGPKIAWKCGRVDDADGSKSGSDGKII